MEAIKHTLAFRRAICPMDTFSMYIGSFPDVHAKCYVNLALIEYVCDNGHKMTV